MVRFYPLFRRASLFFMTVFNDPEYSNARIANNKKKNVYIIDLKQTMMF